MKNIQKTEIKRKERKIKFIKYETNRISQKISVVYLEYQLIDLRLP